jgi:ADP-ribose pyrophosphatase
MKKTSYEMKTIEFDGDSVDFLSMPDTCICLFENSQNEVLLIKQYRPIFGDYFLELHGGSKESHESVEETALREFHEETGYTANNISIVLSVILSIGSSSEKVHIFKVDAIDGNLNDSPEKGIEPIWISSSEVREMIENGLIVDAKTIIALQNMLLSQIAK